MSSKIKIRRTEDLDTVAKIDGLCFDPLYDYPAHTEGCIWWLAYDGDKPIAFAGLKRLVENEGLAYMCRVGVLKEYRGQGLQQRLIHARVNWCRRQKGIYGVITYTIPSNVASSNNLIKCGFKLYRPDYKWEGDNALYWSYDF